MSYPPIPIPVSALDRPSGAAMRIPRSAFFVFYVGYAVFAHGWMLVGLLSGRENAFRMEALTAIAAIAILTACLLWAVLHFRGAVRYLPSLRSEDRKSGSFVRT